jgi:DNA-binding transcriptional LysR family regulator
MPKFLQRLQRITPQQLRAFEATARLGSVTKAALALHVSQPTVSVQLREIASALEEPLFETVGRQLRLTQCGGLLQQTITDINGCWQMLESRLSEVRGLVRGHLRIAAVTTAEYFVPDLLGPFAAAHPGVDIELVVENRDRVVERLTRGHDDLTVMMLPPQDLPLEAVPFLDNPLVVIAPASHALAGKRLPLQRLAKERWLMRESGSGTRMTAEQHFAKVGFQADIAMSLGSNEAIKHAVAAGLGLAVVSRLAVADHLSQTSGADAKLVQLQVQGFPLRRSWSVVWRRDKPLSVAAKRFASYLQEVPRQSKIRPKPAITLP